MALMTPFLFDCLAYEGVCLQRAVDMWLACLEDACVIRVALHTALPPTLPPFTTYPKGSMYQYSIYLGLKGVAFS